MKIFGLNIGRAPAPVRATPGVVRRSGAEASPIAFLRGDDYGGCTTENTFGTVPWVYRAVTALAEQVANTPWVFRNPEGGDKSASGGTTQGAADRLRRFYERPHPHLTAFQYWEQRVMWLQLRGECFRVPVFTGNGATRRLDRVLMLDPSQFDHIIDQGQLVGWRYRARLGKDVMRSQVLLPEEVWFERLSNPYDPWRGLAPLSVAAAAAGSEYAAAQWMKGLMENNGNAGVIVRTEDPLDPDQREELKEALRERRRGVGRADAPLLLWGGAEIVQPRAVSADLQLLQHRRFSLAEICAAFGVPEEIVTTINAAKYDIMRGARLSFVENSVVPLCRRLEAGEHQVVQAIAPGWSGYFESDEHPVMAAARRERLKVAETGFRMGIPLNDLNRVYDLGFPDYPWGNSGYIASGLQAVGKAGNKVES